jgi:hypothetical protein
MGGVYLEVDRLVRDASVLALYEVWKGCEEKELD